MNNAVRSNYFRTDMPNPNGLLSQKLCHYLNQGCTLKDILMRAALWMAYFDLSKLNFAWPNLLELQFSKRDKMTLRTTASKVSIFKIIKIRTSCQYVGYFHCSWNRNWRTQNLQMDCMRPAGGHSCFRIFLFDKCQKARSHLICANTSKFVPIQIFCCKNVFHKLQHITSLSRCFQWVAKKVFLNSFVVNILNKYH